MTSRFAAPTRRIQARLRVSSPPLETASMRASESLNTRLRVLLVPDSMYSGGAQTIARSIAPDAALHRSNPVIISGSVLRQLDGTLQDLPPASIDVVHFLTPPHEATASMHPFVGVTPCISTIHHGNRGQHEVWHPSRCSDAVMTVSRRGRRRAPRRERRRPTEACHAAERRETPMFFGHRPPASGQPCGRG